MLPLPWQISKAKIKKVGQNRDIAQNTHPLPPNTFNPIRTGWGGVGIYPPTVFRPVLEKSSDDQYLKCIDFSKLLVLVLYFFENGQIFRPFSGLKAENFSLLIFRRIEGGLGPERVNSEKGIRAEKKIIKVTIFLASSGFPRRRPCRKLARPRFSWIINLK